MAHTAQLINGGDKVYYSCAETAAFLRAALKRAFPGVKFSVRSKTYSGGASINVSWTDGPTAKEVERVGAFFEGATFDGSIDLKSYHSTKFNGQYVHFGADFIFWRREHSPALCARAYARICQKYGMEPQQWTGDYRKPGGGDRTMRELTERLMSTMRPNGCVIRMKDNING